MDAPTNGILGTMVPFKLKLPNQEDEFSYSLVMFSLVSVEPDQQLRRWLFARKITMRWLVGENRHFVDKLVLETVESFAPCDDESVV